MDTALLERVELQIEANHVPSNSRLFAGADLIVSNDPNRHYEPGDVLVVSSIAKEISWVIFQMQKVFSEKIDYLNKLAFYPSLGKAANKAISSGFTKTQVLQAIVTEAKNFWNPSA